MQTATLGGLIKDYRLRKRLSQLEVSLRIGWSDTTRLSKIEQGRVGKPTRVTVEKIIKALNLTEQEKGEFLLVGGYLPTDEEIKKVVKELKNRIDTWPYPAYLIDFSWRLLIMNEVARQTFGLAKEVLDQSIKAKTNLLEFVLAPTNIMPVEMWRGDNDKSLKPFKVAQVAMFKVEHLGQENDSWYKKLINTLAANEEFRSLWADVKLQDYHKKMLDYEYKEIRSLDKDKPTLKFHIFASRLIQDQRFQIILYLPA